MSWPAKVLGDLVDIKGGGTPSKTVPEYWGGTIPWASVKDFKGGAIERTEDYITELAVSGSSTNVIPAGRIIVPTRMALGKVAINAVDMAINQDLKALQIKDESKLLVRYLFRFLESKAQFLEEQGKGATVKGITLDVLKGLEIPLPPLPEQKRIAAILDKADAIHRKRQQAIQLADDFLRAVFLDMFGDPVTNPKGWPVEHLKDITMKIGSGSTPRGGSEAYLEQGISLIRSLNIHDDDFRMKNLAFIDDEQAEKLSNVLVQSGDVLLNITGASVCRCAIVPTAVLPARVNQHVCIIRPLDAINSSYLLHLLISEPYKQKLLKMSGAGATREALTKQQVELLEVPIPPKELQTKFEEIKEKVRSLSSASDSFKEESFFESLSDKAFSGQL